MSGLSDDTRALLDAARDGDEPSMDDRARVRSMIARRLAVGAAAGAAVATASHVAGGATSAAAGAGAAAVGASATTSIAAGAASGGVAAALFTGLGAKILVSVAIVGAVGAGTVTYTNHEAARRAAPTVSVVAPAASPVARALPAAQVARPSSNAMDPNAVAPSSAPAAVLAAPIASAPAVAVVAAPVMTPPVLPTPAAAPNAAPAASPLDAELAFLQEAHAALRAGEGERALRLYAEYARRFPSGQLAEESEAGRVFALCEVGRIDEARDVASRFLREHPRSPLGPRVARACDADAPSTF